MSAAAFEAANDLTRRQNSVYQSEIKGITRLRSPEKLMTAGQSVYLDMVRGMSAIIVMVGHGLTMMPNPPLIGTRYPIQSLGVLMFFTLSGLLICFNCLSRDRYNFSEYMIDRFARIFTAFIPALILVVLVDNFVLIHWRTISDRSWDTFIANVLMLHHTPYSRLIDGLPWYQPYGTARQFWTVPVEWWMYVTFGIFFFWLAASFRERILMAVLVFPATLTVSFYSYWDWTCTAWIVSAGFGIAFARQKPDEKLKGLSIAAAIFFLMMTVFRWRFLDVEAVMNMFDLQLQLLFVGLVLSLFGVVGGNAFLSNLLIQSRKFWVWLAGISYSLYLTHQTLHFVFYDLAGVMRWRILFLMFATSILLAHIFNKLVDSRYPIVRRYLKNLLAKNRDARAAAASLQSA